MEKMATCMYGITEPVLGTAVNGFEGLRVHFWKSCVV